MKFPTHSLKNEKIEKNNLTESRNLFRKLWINGKGCPKGTVPIRKYTKDAFIHAKLFQESYSTSSAHPNDWNENIAVAFGQVGGERYNGGGVTFGVYNFPIKDNQYSFSQLSIARLPDFLRTGWTIGDKSCYNLLCASFVVLRPDIPVDGILQPRTDGPREMQFIIGRTSGAQWYVQLETAIVGFWPPDLFSGLADLADAVEWGGAVLTVNGEPGPGMGAGWRPVSDSISDGYGRFVSVIDDQNNVVQAGALAVYRSDNVYEFHDLGFVRDNGHLIYYGGPGHQ
uniref:Neprosin PEP catalytic domain-containing protein n=1 Tax=Kalanchoe fedtschenkoi TaxID=63787 RepID=A0A7N1A927_KALFE